MPRQSFVMVCGIPGVGKTALAEQLCRVSSQILMDAGDLYPIKKALSHTGLVFDSAGITADISFNPAYKDAVVLISPNRVREELNNAGIPNYEEALVFAVVDARIQTALASGASVVYEATNLDKHIREKYTEMAARYGVSNTTLHVFWTTPEASRSKEPDWWLHRLYERLRISAPSREEGWSQVISHGELKERAARQATRSTARDSER